MDRYNQEKEYWDNAALDPEVDDKYICNLSKSECLEAVGDLPGLVLDIGCGVGRLMKPGYQGIDVSQNMLEIARRRQPECKFKQNDGRTIPFEDGSFDSAYSVLVFQHLTPGEMAGYISEASRVLKPGGRFVFQFIEGYEDEPFSHHFTMVQIRNLLNANKFTIEVVKRGLVHPQWTWVYVRKDGFKAL